MNLDSRTLPAALKRASERLAEAQPGRHVAYAWIYDDATGTYLLNGASAGFVQWDDDGLSADHFVIFNRPEAINASMRLLESWAFEPTPRLERDPSSNVR